MREEGAANGLVIGFVAAAGLLSALLVLYTLAHRRPPIPADADHATAVVEIHCLRCHGPGMKNARGRNHPLNDRCFDCHERA
jgi:hypothetical protein